MENLKQVRVDTGGRKTPPGQRVYVFIKAGYGEGARTKRARKVSKCAPLEEVSNG